MGREELDIACWSSISHVESGNLKRLAKLSPVLTQKAGYMPKGPINSRGSGGISGASPLLIRYLRKR